MNNMDGLLDMVAARAEAGAETETEYLAEDGLLRCRICGGKRQTVITPPFEGAKPRTVRCWCNCPTEQDRQKERENQIRLSRPNGLRSGEEHFSRRKAEERADLCAEIHHPRGRF